MPGKSDRFNTLEEDKTQESSEEGNIKMDSTKWTTQDPQRLQFFNDSLVYLSVAATKGFNSFKECASMIKNKLNGFPLELTTNPTEFKLDAVSMNIFPTQEFPDFVPIKVSGDGNCLPRSASMLVFGDQQHHVEMRVRLACELALNKDYYLNDDNHKMYEFDTFTYCSTITSYSTNFKQGMELSSGNIKRVFEKDAMRTSKVGSFCGIWHLYALSSIVGCKLYSIYPKLKSTVTIRPELNRIIFPRKQLSKRKLAIFWTNTCGLKGDTFWSPNHFSPCFPKHFVLEAKQQFSPMKLATALKRDLLNKQSRSVPKKEQTSGLNYNSEKLNRPMTSERSTLAEKMAPTKQLEQTPRKTNGEHTQTRLNVSDIQTPRKNNVRFNVESKCDLAINFVSKHSKKIQIKSLKKGKNPLKNIFKFFIGQKQLDSRGPDVSIYEIE